MAVPDLNLNYLNKQVAGRRRDLESLIGRELPRTQEALAEVEAATSAWVARGVDVVTAAPHIARVPAAGARGRGVVDDTQTDTGVRPVIWEANDWKVLVGPPRMGTGGTRMLVTATLPETSPFMPGQLIEFESRDRYPAGSTRELLELGSTETAVNGRAAEIRRAHQKAGKRKKGAEEAPEPETWPRPHWREREARTEAMAEVSAPLLEQIGAPRELDEALLTAALEELHGVERNHGQLIGTVGFIDMTDALVAVAHPLAEADDRFKVFDGIVDRLRDSSEALRGRFFSEFRPEAHRRREALRAAPPAEKPERAAHVVALWHEDGFDSPFTGEPGAIEWAYYDSPRYVASAMAAWVCTPGRPKHVFDRTISFLLHADGSSVEGNPKVPTITQAVRYLNTGSKLTDTSDAAHMVADYALRSSAELGKYVGPEAVVALTEAIPEILRATLEAGNAETTALASVAMLQLTQRCGDRRSAPIAEAIADANKKVVRQLAQADPHAAIAYVNRFDELVVGESTLRTDLATIAEREVARLERTGEPAAMELWREAEIGVE
jgi:hypothetical protein